MDSTGCVVTVMGKNDSNPQQVVTLGSGYTVINITGIALEVVFVN